MLTSMVRMYHFVLDSNIIPTKELNHLSTRMDKVGNVVYDSVDCQFGAAETFDGPEGWVCCLIILVGSSIARIDQAITEDVGAGVGRHGFKEQMAKKRKR